MYINKSILFPLLQSIRNIKCMQECEKKFEKEVLKSINKIFHWLTIALSKDEIT